MFIKACSKGTEKKMEGFQTWTNANIQFVLPLFHDKQHPNQYNKNKLIGSLYLQWAFFYGVF